jgi:hypothetical protein
MIDDIGFGARKVLGRLVGDGIVRLISVQLKEGHQEPGEGD